MIKSSRRSFIKGVAVAGSVAFLPNIGLGSEKNNNGKFSHKILSCNIRVDLPVDEEKGVGWSKRKDLCVKVIKNQNPDIICLQEVLKVQNSDFKKAFPDFQLLGFAGPEMDAFDDDQYHGIAKNPILFSTKRYSLIAAGTYWLSETPLKGGSLSWSTARARHVNWVRLEDKLTGKEFRVLNLHLDHVNQQAKVKQIELVIEEASQYRDTFPQIITGDFNSHADGPVIGGLKNNNWKDTYEVMHGGEESGFTGHGFKPEVKMKKGKGKRIDFILLKGNASVVSASILKDNENGFYPSDHYFMASEFDVL